MITGAEFAAQARSQEYDGIPYNKLDCQAFVERVLKDCGVRKPDGSVYNWKGSNSMWRTINGWKGTVKMCIQQFDGIPDGAWVFIRKTDGGEKEHGYKDNLGNFSHVGIYCAEDPNPVRDSTRYAGRDGVGYRPVGSFNYVLLPEFINYTTFVPDIDLVNLVHVLRDPESSDTDFLKALTTLNDYLKGV